MYIGHYAVAFAAKRLAPKASLGVLLLASTFTDLLWPMFLLLGWERVEIEPGNTAFTPLNFARTAGSCSRQDAPVDAVSQTPRQ